jgi:hypothetical protein
VGAVLAVALFGVGGALVLAGAVTLAMGASSLTPELEGPVSWAAGVILEVTALGALSLLGHVVSHSPLPWVVVDLYLLLPIGLGLGLYWACRARGRHRRDERLSSHGWIALLLSAPVLIGVAWLGWHDQARLLAMAMNGDAVQHLTIATSIVHQGGLSIADLRLYPAWMNAIEGLIGSAQPTGSLSHTQVLTHQLLAQSHLVSLSILACSLLLGAAVLCFVPASPRRLPVASVLVVVASSTVAYSEMALLPAYLGGFITSLPSVALCLAIAVVGVRNMARPNPVSLGLLVLSIIPVFTSWSMLVVVPITFFVASALRALATRVARRSLDRATGVLVVLGALEIAACLGAIVLNLHTLHRDLVSSGAFVPYGKGTLLVVALGCLAALALLWRRRERAMVWPMVALVIVGMVLVEVLRALCGPQNARISGWPLFPLSGGWSYYALKTMWQFTLICSWVLFVPLFLWCLAARATRLKVLAVVGAVALIPLTIAITAVPAEGLSVVTLARQGWTGPSVKAVNTLLATGDLRTPFVYFDTGLANEDARILNRWTANLWGMMPSLASSTYQPTIRDEANPEAERLWQWAQSKDTTPASLCSFVASYPTTAPVLTIYTGSRDAAAQLTASCPTEMARVHLVDLSTH